MSANRPALLARIVAPGALLLSFLALPGCHSLWAPGEPGMYRQSESHDEAIRKKAANDDSIPHAGQTVTDAASPAAAQPFTRRTRQ